MAITFQGNETALLDGNGRVSFPALFRKLLPEGEKEFYISPGNNFTLNLRRVADYEAWLETLKNLDKTPKNYDLRRKILYNTQKITLDEKQNRFILPQELKKFAKIDKEVVFAGNIDTVVISNQDNASRYELSDSDDFSGYEGIL